MTWLVTHMWAALAVAAFLGLLIGWAIRGLGRKSAAEQPADLSEYEHEIARLNKDNELLRQQIAEGSAQATEAAMAQEGAAEQRITAMRAELDKARTELGDLRVELEKAREARESGGLATAGTAVAAGVAGLAAGAMAGGKDDDGEVKRLTEEVETLTGERNQALAALEEMKAAAPDPTEIDRLRAEFAQVSAERDAAKAEATAATPETVEVDMSTGDDGLALSSPDNSVEWQNRYLESRVRYLESRLEGSAVTAAPSEAVTVSQPVDTDELDGLKAEIARLEKEVETAKTTSAGAGAVTGALAGAAATVMATSDKSADDAEDVERSKLVWQNRYLQSRLRYFEENLAAETPATATPVSNGSDLGVDEDMQARIDAAEANEVELKRLRAQLSDAASAGGESEEELARLRWRNRYLEGRLKYLEGPEGSDEPAAAVANVTPDNTVEPEPAPATEAEPEVSEAGGKQYVDDIVLIGGVGDGLAQKMRELGLVHLAQLADLSEDEASDLEARLELPQGQIAQQEWVAQAKELIRGDVPRTKVDKALWEQALADGKGVPVLDDAPAFAVAEGTERRPAALDGPRDGQGDDLTKIGGVGERIQTVLNELGIYHYDQISSWTPEEAAWVDGYLRFSGRIAREKWVDQAKVLAG